MSWKWLIFTTIHTNTILSNFPIVTVFILPSILLFVFLFLSLSNLPQNHIYLHLFISSDLVSTIFSQLVQEDHLVFGNKALAQSITTITSSLIHAAFIHSLLSGHLTYCLPDKENGFSSPEKVKGSLWNVISICLRRNISRLLTEMRNTFNYISVYMWDYCLTCKVSMDLLQ